MALGTPEVFLNPSCDVLTRSHTDSNSPIIQLHRDAQLPISRAVSMGRRNTKLEVHLQESQKLKSFGSDESNGTLPWLGSD
jgi:hypothetical protein